MHQSHNIPWHILSTHFKVVYDDRSVTPPRSHIRLKNREHDPSVQPALVHFIRKFKSTIRMFSDTERKKYPLTFPAPTTGPIFSDALKEKYPEYLNDRNQDISFWISRAQYTLEDGTQNVQYHTSHAELADVIKVLIHENEMPTLLMLAQHPQIPIADLHWLSWGHHFGWSRSSEEALSAYLFFNSVEALGIVENGGYTRLDSYAGLLGILGISMDYPAQQVTHRQFFKDINVLDIIQGLCGDWSVRMEAVKGMMLHKDYERFQRYMKELFEILYRYDVLTRECGLENDPRGLNWEVEIARTGLFLNVVEVEDVYLEKENRWLHFLKTTS